MGILKIVYREAVYREDLHRDPSAGLGVIKYQQREAGTFTMPELQLLFPAHTLGPWSSLEAHACFLMAAATGMRRSEVLAVRWENVDLVQGYIRVSEAWKDHHELGKPKFERERYAPFLFLADQLISRLGELKATAQHELVFCNEKGRRRGETWWLKQFHAAMVKASIDTPARSLKPHSFRHTLNSLLLAAGRDPNKVRVCLGWRQESVQEDYTHFRPEDFRSLQI